MITKLIDGFFSTWYEVGLFMEYERRDFKYHTGTSFPENAVAQALAHGLNLRNIQ